MAEPRENLNELISEAAVNKRVKEIAADISKNIMMKRQS